MNNNSQKVGVGEKVSYFLANIGNIPLMTLLSTFFLIFYTDVVGLNAGALATLFLISKVVDGISDPLMGFFLDKFPITKMGKFRPMLMLGTVICVINYILLWFGAVWSPVRKYAIVYITYILLGWTFDIMDISLNSLLPVMTTDNKERNQLSLIKAIGYTIGGMGLSVVGPIIVASGTLESYYVLIFGAMAVTLVCSIVGALGVKERVAFDGTEEEKYKIKDLFKFLFTKPVIVTFLASLLYFVGYQGAAGAGTYYFTYIMGDLSLMAGVSGVSMIGMVPGMIVAPLLANKIGKKKVFTAGIFICAIGPALRLFAPTSLTMAYVGTFVASLGAGFIMPLNYGVQADNTLYVQYTTGKHAEAAIASLSSFITKVGQGIAGAFPGYVLAACGYINGAAEQPASVHTGIIACVLVVPFVLGIIGGIVFLFGYKLEKDDVDRMAREIAEKESAKA